MIKKYETRKKIGKKRRRENRKGKKHYEFTCKHLTRLTSTLAYFAPALVTKEKSYTTQKHIDAIIYII